MATKRRGGFGPPELRGTLGTLLRTTTGVVRDVFERGAREGRARFDDARANRRRQDALAELGELVLDLIRRGEIDLAELPEARDLVHQLDEFDAEPADEPTQEAPRAISRSRFDERARRPTPPPSDDGRSRFDERARRPTPPPSDDGTVSSSAVPRAQRPTPTPSGTPSGDGTVSSSAVPRANQPTPAPVNDGITSSRATVQPSWLNSAALPGNSDAPSTRAPTKPIRDSWRQPLDEVPTLADMPSAKRPSSQDVPTLADLPAAKRSLPHDPQRKGGISFDDDDLHEYMHPDDVPPKGPPKNPGDGGA